MGHSRSSSKSGRAGRSAVKKSDPLTRLYQSPAIDLRTFQGTAGVEIRNVNVPDLARMGVLPEEYFLDRLNSELTGLLDFDSSKGPPVQDAWSVPGGTILLKMQSNMLVASALRVLDNLRLLNRRLKVRAIPLDLESAAAPPQLEDGTGTCTAERDVHTAEGAAPEAEQQDTAPEAERQEYGGIFHQRLISSYPPTAKYPKDVHVPFSDFAEITHATQESDGNFAPEPDSCEGVHVLDTMRQREHFKESLVGKRVLHVKGFGSGFKDPTASQVALQEKQEEEAIDAIMQFNPDFIAVDGNPWGNGFQRYIKAFVDAKCFSADPLPCLIWAKSVALATSNDGRPASNEEREQCLKLARGWAEQGISVTVFWIDPDLINAKIAMMFGDEHLKSLQPEKFNTRGIIRILCNDPAAWVSAVDPAILQALAAVEDPARKSRQFFEKCSFENAAKGNVLFDALDVPTSASHGVISFGGGESVLLELATLYLNSGSGFKSKAAVYPFSRGTEDTDPALPRHIGSALVYDEDALLEGVLSGWA